MEWQWPYTADWSRDAHFPLPTPPTNCSRGCWDLWRQRGGSWKDVTRIPLSCLPPVMPVHGGTDRMRWRVSAELSWSPCVYRRLELLSKIDAGKRKQVAYRFVCHRWIVHHFHTVARNTRYQWRYTECYFTYLLLDYFYRATHMSRRNLTESICCRLLYSMLDTNKCTTNLQLVAMLRHCGVGAKTVVQQVHNNTTANQSNEANIYSALNIQVGPKNGTIFVRLNFIKY